MNLERYQMQFHRYKEQAHKLRENSKTKDELQIKFSELSKDATFFYEKYSHPMANDYSLRIKIFLDFDEFLKQSKREFKLPVPDKIIQGFFMNRCQYQVGAPLIYDPEHPLNMRKV